MNKIYNEVKKIIPEVYLVGGSVRDLLLKKEPHDYDFTTPLLPEEVENNIRSSGKKPYLIGKKFGTIGCKIDGLMIEITTFRAEKYSESNRKPEVTFVANINDDLSRRDFTINSMAYDGNNIIDPFGGQSDLNANILKCVGNPAHRFQEDPLRMLRLFRFGAQLDSDFETETYEACKQLNYKILSVSKERWVLELDKLLVAPFVSVGLDGLMGSHLLNYILPELILQYQYNQNNPHHSLDLWSHTVKVVQNLPQDIELRWAGLLHDIAKPFVRTENKNGYSNYIKHDLLGGEFILRLANYLKWSNSRTKNIYNLVINHSLDSSPLKKADQEAK